MKLGARIFKTGIAITLALVLADLLNLSAPVFAGIAAIFAIQPSIYRSVISVIEQFQANVIGAALAIFSVLLFGNDPFIIGLTSILVIAITIKLKIETTIPVAVVTVIAIMQNPGEEFLSFAALRFSTIMLGILSAFVVNLFFMPPKHEKKLYYKIVDQTEEILKWIRMNTRNASEFGVLKSDIDKIKDGMQKVEQFYVLYKEERNYLKKNKYVKARKLVIYRQMIKTTNKALHTLKKLHRLENELKSMPDDLQQLIIEELNDLLYFHEQVLLKYIRKTKPHPEDLHGELEFNKKSVIERFVQYNKLDDERAQKDWYHLFPLISTIVEYSDEMEHLDTLIDRYQAHHNADDDFGKNA
ncbi:aromatic acid exporter family protein [Cytobacillus suaedae]|nr:aromatic acid exporter family protein [Cytobacillus suaedae]